MKHILVHTILFFLALVTASAQQKDYFQQSLDYDIDVALDRPSKILDAQMKLRYKNNSPDTLKFIYFHLWPNAYRNNNTRFAEESAMFRHYDVGRGGIDSLDFKVEGKSAQFELDSIHIDYGKLLLNEPILPGQRITITTPFKVKLPYVWSRGGYETDGASITQWYPKPAVYDKSGWHPMPYQDQGEFYAEFASFDVSITVPKNYVVGATGQLMTKSELKWLNVRDSLSRIAIEEDRPLTEYITEEAGTKTIRYIERNVTDFAWFAYKNYYVLNSAIELESGKKVQTHALFGEEDKKLWKQAPLYLNESVYYYSKWVGDYPYGHCTAVGGKLLAGGGMEYPTITIIAPVSTPAELEQTIIHEVGHNWFQGILGSDERKHPWLDEGINSFYEKRLTDLVEKERGDYGKVRLFGKNYNGFFKTNHFCMQETFVKLSAASNSDQECHLHSDEFDANNYGTSLYFKTALAMQHMMHYLGEEEFDRLMQKYYQKWKFKHPGPDDLKAIFDESPKDLDFFFEDFLKTIKRVDYGFVKKAKLGEQIGPKSYDRIYVKNYGEVKAPFTISGVKNDSIVNTIWYDGFKGTMDVLFPSGDYDYYQIDADHVLMDWDRNNHQLKTKGLLKKIEPLRFQFGLKVNNGEKTEIAYTPLLLWNSYDETMLGVAFYNGLIFPQNFEYAFAPLYSLGSNKLMGSGKLAYNWFNNNYATVKRVTVGNNITRFSSGEYQLQNFGYLKNTSYVQVKFKTSIPEGYQKLQFRTLYLNKESVIAGQVIGRDFMHYELSYKQGSNVLFRENHQQVVLRKGDSYTLLQGETKHKWAYRGDYRTISLRLFAGGFLQADVDELNEIGDPVNLQMSGGYGFGDYLMDDLYLARSAQSNNINGSFLANQAYERGGAMKVASRYGQTFSYLLASNIEARIPIKLPISAFVDLATNGEMISSSDGSDKFAYNYGLAIPLGIMKVYVPLGMSNDLKQAFETSRLYRISFSLNLTDGNPFVLREKYLDF